MNYNDFTYYRANPYARQGYIPPIAYVNRHKPQFMTELPMGQDHLSKIGRRQYANGTHRSNIESENILKSPQRYPFENRIALQKGYERNMNTIDIEGASSGTLMSQAVKNKLKARQDLIRRHRDGQPSSYQQLKSLEATEQERRRQIANQQYLRNQQIQQFNSGKSRPEYNYQQYSKPGIANSNSSMGHYYQNGPSDNFQRKTKTPQKINEEDNAIRADRNVRHQSIQITRPSQNPQSDNYAPPKKNYFEPVITRQYNNLEEQGQEALLHESLNSFQNSPQLTKNAASSSRLVDRRQFRQQNPTILSSQNSIYLAGKNLMAN